MKTEASKGNLIKFETDTLMGWRFRPGDFPFATTIEGQAIAGRYDPMVASAVKRIEERLGRSLGDDDNDGRWTVIGLSQEQDLVTVEPFAEIALELGGLWADLEDQ